MLKKRCSMLACSPIGASSLHIPPLAMLGPQLAPIKYRVHVAGAPFCCPTAKEEMNSSTWRQETRHMKLRESKPGNMSSAKVSLCIIWGGATYRIGPSPPGAIDKNKILGLSSTPLAMTPFTSTLAVVAANARLVMSGEATASGECTSATSSGSGSTSTATTLFPNDSLAFSPQSRKSRHVSILGVMVTAGLPLYSVTVLTPVFLHSVFDLSTCAERCSSVEMVSGRDRKVDNIHVIGKATA
mmetsp:Transcript_23060/g.22798  ORF Transcript_23060/g.22798 Transcript_23060/m.22798 type:complete len:242 (+) Transcript_23060:516-1241(+)